MKTVIIKQIFAVFEGIHSDIFTFMYILPTLRFGNTGCLKKNAPRSIDPCGTSNMYNYAKQIMCMKANHSGHV